MSKINKKALIAMGVVFALMVGATVLWAAVTEQWSGDASGEIEEVDFTPMANWQGYIEPHGSYDSFFGTWYDGTHAGTCCGARYPINSDSASFSGNWEDTTVEGYSGNLTGKFYNTGGNAFYDTVQGNWYVYGGSDNGTWWGARDWPTE